MTKLHNVVIVLSIVLPTVLLPTTAMGQAGTSGGGIIMQRTPECATQAFNNAALGGKTALSGLTDSCKFSVGEADCLSEIVGTRGLINGSYLIFDADVASCSAHIDSETMDRIQKSSRY